MSASDGSDSGATAALVQELIELHRDARITAYGAVAAYTWLYLDYIMMLPTEIRYVWGAKWNVSKLLFLWASICLLLMVNAGVAMTGGHSVKVLYFYWEGNAVMMFTIHVILQLRIYAMYNRNKKLAIFNLIFFILEYGSSSAVYNYGISIGTTLPTPPGLTGCYGITTSFLFTIWLPALAFELWLVFLAIWKACQRHRDRFAVNGQRLDLLSVLIRDNVIYFVVIAIGLLVNTIMWTAAPPGLASVAVPLSHTSMIISGSRLLLNLFEAHERTLRSGGPTTTLGVATTQQQSTLVFNRDERSRWTDMGVLTEDFVAVDMDAEMNEPEEKGREEEYVVDIMRGCDHEERQRHATEA
ncbi:hypothetical protein OH77DRAFT_1389092 [Trametes cingulata]|nr:hypothetical protein OH77DRAFT_1389092 [Trametes cingulata]